MSETVQTRTPKLPDRSVSRNWEWVLGWLLPALGLIAAILKAIGVDLSLGILGLFTCVAFSVIVHEIAHFVVGRWVGLQPCCLRVGHGATVFDRQFSSFRLVLGALPYSGAVYPHAFPTLKGWIRLRCFVMVAVGPLSNAILLGIFALAALGSQQDHGFTALPTQMILANTYLLLFSVIPHSAISDGDSVGNDGLQMLQLITGRSSWGFQSKNSAKAKDSDSSRHWPADELSAELLLANCRAALRDPCLPHDRRCHLLDCFATCVLMYGLRDELPEADRCSEELLRAMPDEWTVKGTRGSILVEIDEIESGVTMLKEVMEHAPSTFDRAIAASFLGLAELKKNNRDAAAEWLRASRELDPKCASLRRIETLFSKQGDDSMSAPLCEKPRAGAKGIPGNSRLSRLLSAAISERLHLHSFADRASWCTLRRNLHAAGESISRVKCMSDRSPKSKQKKSSQKQAKVASAAEIRKAAAASKQAAPKKK